MTDITKYKGLLLTRVGVITICKITSLLMARDNLEGQPPGLGWLAVPTEVNFKGSINGENLY